MSDPILKIITLGFPWQTEDPFLFCVHHHDAYPSGNARLGPNASLAGRNLGQDFEGKDGWRMYHGQTVPGFPQHPHRGFETITITRTGFIDHADSLGATARFGGGDVQWMTAGRGIVHAEMFPLLDEKSPNPVELFQIWLNLPAARKMVAPHFSMLWHEKIPRRVFTDAHGRRSEVTIIAGALGDERPLPPPPASFAAQADSDVAIWTIKLSKDATLRLPPARAGSRRSIYFFAGDALRVAGQIVPPGHGVSVRAEAEITLEAGSSPVELLVLQGRPIGEPVVQYGPFVMNTRAEIEAAFRDYQRTQFGGWPWPSDDPVHQRQTGRFAKHADGKIEHAG